MITSMALVLLGVLIVLCFLSCYVELPHDSVLLKVIFALIIVDFGALAYLTDPYPGSDLSRYFVEMQLMERYGLSYLPDSRYVSTPITNFLFYLVAQTGNYHLLPMISASVTTALLLVVWSSQRDLLGVSSRILFLTLVCSISVNGILSILIGGRQHLAFSMLLFAVWYDFSHQKSISKVPIKLSLYLVPVMIHVGTAPLYLASLVAHIMPEKKPVWYLVLAAVIVSVVSGPLLNMMAASNIGGGLVSEIASKFNEYQTSGEFWDWRIHALNMAVCLVLAFLILRVVQDGWTNSASGVLAYERALLVVAVMALCYATDYHLASRILAFALYGSLPVMARLPALGKRDRIVWMASAVFGIMIALETAYQYVSIITQWELIWM